MHESDDESDKNEIENEFDEHEEVNQEESQQVILENPPADQQLRERRLINGTKAWPQHSCLAAA